MIAALVPEIVRLNVPFVGHTSIGSYRHHLFGRHQSTARRYPFS